VKDIDQSILSDIVSTRSIFTECHEFIFNDRFNNRTKILFNLLYCVLCIYIYICICYIILYI